MYPLLVKMVCCFVAALKKIFHQFANANRSLNISIENSVCLLKRMKLMFANTILKDNYCPGSGTWSPGPTTGLCLSGGHHQVALELAVV